MSKEAIDAVLAAEKEAKEKKARAAEQSQKTVTDAANAAKARYEAAREAAMNEMAASLDEIGSQAEALLKKSRSEAESDAAAETRAAEEHMDDAVSLIIGELLKNAGN